MGLITAGQSFEGEVIAPGVGLGYVGKVGEAFDESTQGLPGTLKAGSSLPPGLVLSGGRIAGVPTTRGSYSPVFEGQLIATAIEAGRAYSFALKNDGTAVGWGWDEQEANAAGSAWISVPSGLSGIVAIAAGWDHALALKSNGEVVGWGSNNNGQTTIPSGLSGVVAIAAGGSFSLALKGDGTVVGWGFNEFYNGVIPGELSGVIAIAADTFHALALRNDGTVVGWGGTGAPVIPGGLSDVIAIAAGDSYSLALKGDGTVVGWGYGGWDTTTIPSGLSGVVAISAGAIHALALKSNGTVVGWGRDNNGETTIPSGLSGVVAIAAGSGFSLALKGDGTVVGWGLNHRGQTTIPTITQSAYFTITEGVPIIPAGQTASGTVGAAFSKTFSLTDSTNRPVTSWSATGLPNWATLNTSTGAITGTPQESGSTAISLTATGAGGADTETAAISIAPPPPPKVLFQKPEFANAPDPANDFVLRGDNYFFARWTGAGSIPPGINWVGMEDGLRFWGTPTQIGDWEAEFEGPYPPNFHSELTRGGSDEPSLQLDAGSIPDQIVVQKFYLRFGVVGQEGYTFGQVLSELSLNPSFSQTARRMAWSGSRCIGMRGLSPSLAESGNAPVISADVATGLEAVALNLAQKINGSGIVTASASGRVIVITALENGQLTISATSSRQGAVSVASVTPGSTTAKQVSSVTLGGSFFGGVSYSVSFGEYSYTVTTEAKAKAGMWMYQDAADAVGILDLAVSRPLKNYDLVAEDYLAADWFFSSEAVIGRSLENCFLTAGVSGIPRVGGEILNSEILL